MIQFFNKKLRNKKGFTLIELIVVIAVLGILAAVAVPRLNRFTEKAKISADKATFAALSSTIAIGVTDESIKGNVVVTSTATTGKITITVGGADNTDLLESGAAFKLDVNKGTTSADGTTTAGETFTWKISDGKITDAPTIDEVSGEITTITP